MHKRLLLLLLATLLASAVSAAQSASFQLKGLRIGMPAKEACGRSEVTTEMEDLIRESRKYLPNLIEMGTTECEIEVGTFGGHDVEEPVRLLFLNDQLILVKLQLSDLSLAKFVDIYKALTQDYGKPLRTISRPFVTDTWRIRGQTFILERQGFEWDNNNVDNNNVTIILRQDSGYRTYTTRSEVNSKLMKAFDEGQTRKDMR